ncbi:MAG: cache domain-containing protein [Syntrophobacteraceae bacterium]|jgi:signal transduction histidine kinase
MKVFFKELIVAFCALFLFSAIPALAQKTPDELAKESEDACAASASTKPTPQMIVDKVEKAAALLQKEGKAAFPKFRGKDSEFIFAGTYVWIHDLSGIMRVHPVKYKMEGQNCVDLKDSTGKLFFIEMNEVAKTKGSGWVAYMWPKPGEKTPSQKVSYVKLVKVDGEDLVLGCGVYDMPPEEVQKLVK